MDTLTLRFETYPEDELVLRVSAVPLADYFDLAELRVRLRREDYRRLAEMLAPLLVSWTFAWPLDAEGLMRLDPNVLLAVRNEWCRGVAELPLPLPVTSSAGTTPVRETSPANSTGPSASTGSSSGMGATRSRRSSAKTSASSA